MSKEVIRTVCEGCMSGCGMLVHRENGKVIKITGDPDHPQNNGRIEIKGATYTELVYHPDRIKHPMKRVGQRGGGKWMEISWDQALDEIAAKFNEIIDRYGPEAISHGFGTYPKGGVIPTFIFCQAINSPHHICIDAPYCFTPHIIADVVTYGKSVKCETTGAYFDDTRAIVLWGHNIAVSFPPKWWKIQAAQKKGAKIIVVDPRRNEVVENADLWLRIKPATDDALALGWLNVIIKEGLYDDVFLKKWSNGVFLIRTDNNRPLMENEIRHDGNPSNYVVWDSKSNTLTSYNPETLEYENGEIEPALSGKFDINLISGNQVKCETVWERFKAVVETYPPERVAELTWIPADQIVDAARLYAGSKPAALITHMGPAMQSNVIQTSRMLSILIAVTGNFDVKDGNGVPQYPIDSYVEMSMKVHRASREIEEKQIGAKEYPLFSGPDSIRAKVHPGLWYKDIEDGKITKALWTTSNPVLNSEDSTRVIKALKKLELIVVVDFFRTPTADIADYILPPATWLERDEIADSVNYPNFIAARQKVIEPVGECRCEFDIVFDLLDRMGVELPFPVPIKSAKDLFDFRLKKLNMTFDEFKKRGIVSTPLIEKKYEKGLLRADGKPGFDTLTGKCEIWATRLEKFGYEPLPYYIDKYPSEDVLKDYPLILTDGRILEIYHGLGVTLPSRRKKIPDPILEMHPETAESMGISEGDWVWIETHHNENRFKRKVTFSSYLHPKVVWGNTHFFYPEKMTLKERLESNINLAHTMDEPLDPIDGAPQMRGVPCRITPAE